MASASSETACECTFDNAEVERIELPEIDYSILTTLLEESHAEGNEEQPASNYPLLAASDDLHGDCEDYELEDMLFDTDCSTPLSMHDEAAFSWVDMDVLVPSSPSDGMCDWFLSTGDVGVVDYEDSEGYLLGSYYCGDMPMEAGYSPLWQ